jgi:hypothetical protein
MNLRIETENGQPKNHPALEGNILQAFGTIPAHWEPFIRVERPVLTPYQVMGSDQPVYQKVNGVWTDVWDVREISAEEKAAKQQRVKDGWATIPNPDNFLTWTFDEDTCAYQPPIPRPVDRQVFWQGTTNTWVDIPTYPTDGKTYRLDIASATWVLVQP